MKEKLRTLKCFRVIGLSTRTSCHLESNPETARIPGLWLRLLDKGSMFQIRSRVNRIEYLTIYTNFECDWRGAFTAIAGQRVLGTNQPPEGLEEFAFEAGQYLLFTANGKSADAVDKGWKRAFRSISPPTRSTRELTRTTLR
jgi:predicted transcriptional regulator YdeE